VSKGGRGTSERRSREPGGATEGSAAEWANGERSDP
jgi:hypothetical protein